MLHVTYQRHDQYVGDLITRAQGVYELWGFGNDFPALKEDIQQSLGSVFQEQWASASFRINVDTWGHTTDQAEQVALIDQLGFLPVQVQPSILRQALRSRSPALQSARLHTTVLVGSALPFLMYHSHAGNGRHPSPVNPRGLQHAQRLTRQKRELTQSLPCLIPC